MGSVFAFTHCDSSNFLGYVEAPDGSASSQDGSLGDGGDETDDDDSDPFQACATNNYSIGLLPLDMMLALDTSYSMDFAPEDTALTKWESVRGAIKDFISDTSLNGIGVGIQYFPLRNICSVEDYKNPAVPISMLPESAEQIIDSLYGQRMAEGTPMVPMLQGVYEYTKTWAEQNTDRRVAVVLSTDGIPDNTCLAPDGTAPINTLDNVERLAKEAVEGEASLNTFVIGVGSELTALNRISRAGNGNDAILVDIQSGDVQAAFLEALESIRRQSVCEYDIVEIAGGQMIDTRAVNVFFSNERITTTFGNVENEAGCVRAPDNGWYYDNPSDPKKIVLCDETCFKVQSREGGDLEIAFGCQMIVY